MICGVPYDSSETYRTGSRFAPNAIREASLEIEDYDILEDFDLPEIPLADYGDVAVSFGNAEETMKRTKVVKAVRLVVKATDERF